MSRDREYLFRHQYSRLVAVLTGKFGVQHLELVEDAVQSAMLSALEHWTGGIPENPAGWLYTVARNNALDEIRKQHGREAILGQLAQNLSETSVPLFESHSAGEVADDLLRMMFVCSDRELPMESQIVLALKVLCGFGVPEIANHLFATEASIYKRLSRARATLRENQIRIDEQTIAKLIPRVSSVHKILYVLFTEGHLSSVEEVAIRRDLCEEAIRLCTLLSEHPVGDIPETYALLALMHFHVARFDGRQDEFGGLLLLEEQNRDAWDQESIAIGMRYLAKSAAGKRFTRFHAEAGIAAEHCRASSFDETRWDKIADCYEILETESPSPIHRLNHAIALAEIGGGAAGLKLLDGHEPPSWLAGSYLWALTLADLHRRAGNEALAEKYRLSAIDLAPTEAVRTTIIRRLTSTPEQN